MSSDALMQCTASVISQLTGAVFLVQLSDRWRFPLRKSLLILLVVSAAAVLAQMLLFLRLPLDSANFFAMLTDVTILLLAPLLLHWSRGRLLFSMATTYSFSFSTVFFSHMVFPAIGPAHLMARLCISAVTFLFLWRWFAPCLRSVYRSDISGWAALSLIPLLYCLIFFILTAGKFVSAAPVSKLFPGIPDLTVHYILLVLPTSTYFVLYHMFRALRQSYTESRQYAQLSAQVTVMDTHAQYEARLQQEYSTCLELLGKDLAEVETLLRAGDSAAALALSEGAEERVSTLMRSAARRRITDIPVLDAVLSDYSAVAEREGVTLSIQFSLPQRYGFDLSALAVVLSNALENAMAACRTQPDGREKSIRLTSSALPDQFFLLLENTCDVPVEFDAEGFPITHRPGHGYGTRSIAAFAQQNHGVFQYKWHDHWFTMQLLL